ncbi:MAG TPA: DUF362 domain-containing protein [Methanotrichaceae archaeon]|nr:DUF362 domain-containing protein [Methanotrichaceae archaeon]
MNLRMKLTHYIRHSFFLLGLLSIAWFIFRTGTKPTRAAYPCQQATAAAGYLWMTAYILPFVSAIRQPFATPKRAAAISIAVIALVLMASGVLTASESNPASGEAAAPNISESLAKASPASDIFAVNGTSGDDDGVKDLIKLMHDHGTQFYNISGSGHGLISRDDVVIIKVNSQWDQRGGTNTDLIRSLIRAILDHPDGFDGEIVIADNGQSQYGPTGQGGSLNYSRNNARDTSQSMQNVADSFSGSRVSTYLWDAITTTRVKEYFDGDSRDGYIVADLPDEQTGILVSYPKFTTRFGTKISFKMGVWDPKNRAYNSSRLKVINVPVLKSHAIYGVTASIKHYMGVTSDKLTSSLGGRSGQSHFAIGAGGMGTEMVETRFPALNIIDAIWINANPGKGPSTSYNAATNAGIIAARTDPAALDCWAAKNILMPAARAKGYSDLSSMDPDNTASGTFGDWLRLASQEIKGSGMTLNIDEGSMNIYVC